MENKNLIERLLAMPQLLREAQSRLVELTQNSQKISSEIVKHEMKIKSQIATAADESGKKKYSNDDARKAAVAEVAESDLELIDLRDKAAVLDREIQEEKINYDCLSSEQKNIRVVLMFLSGREGLD